MELITEPANELHFKGPFDSVKATHLKLINPTDRKIIFKIKTTAPKYYCVRPNGGVLPPKEETKISVMLQPFDVKNEDRTKDKFMVQSTFIPEDKEDQISSNEYPSHLWNEIPPSELKNRKLKCVFFPFSDSEEPIPTVAAVTSIVNDTVPKAKPTIPESKVSESEELKKLQEEYKALKSEVNSLLNENRMLKEESMRSRTAYSARATTKQQEQEATSAKSGTGSKDVTPISQLPIYLVLTCVLILLLGVYIGKSVL